MLNCNNILQYHDDVIQNVTPPRAFSNISHNAAEMETSPYYSWFQKLD